MANSLESLRKLKEKLNQKSNSSISVDNKKLESLRKLKEKLNITPEENKTEIVKDSSNDADILRQETLPRWKQSTIDNTNREKTQETQQQVNKVMVSKSNQTPIDIREKNQNFFSDPYALRNEIAKGTVKALDIASRPANAVVNILKNQNDIPEYVKVDGKMYKVKPQPKENIGTAFIKGITGEERPEALEMIAPKSIIEKAKKENPFLTGLSEFILATVTDPTTYIGGEALKSVTQKLLGKIPLEITQKLAKGTAKVEDIAKATGKTEEEVQRLLDNEAADLALKDAKPTEQWMKNQNLSKEITTEPVINITTETAAKSIVKEGTEQLPSKQLINEPIDIKFTDEEIKQAQKELPETKEELQKYINNINSQISKTVDPMLLRKFDLQKFAADDKLKKISEFKTNSMKNAPLLQTEELQNVVDDIEAIYGVKTDKDSIVKAKEMVDADPEGTIRRIRSDNTSSFKNKEDVAASWYILKKFVDDNDTTNVKRWLEITQPKVTSTAQSLQGVSLYKKLSPEGVLLDAQKRVKKAEDDLLKADPKKAKQIEDETKQVTDEIDKIDKETSNDIVDDINKKADEINKTPKKESTGKNSNKEKQPSEKEEMKPEDILAKKIEDYIKDPKVAEEDPIKDMVNELFRVAQESLIDKPKIQSKSAIEFVSEAIKNRQKFVETWKKAKELIREKFKDNADALAKLDNYFDKGIKPPFSEKSFAKSITEGMKSLDLNIGEIVRDYYNIGSKSRQDLVDYLIEKAGLDGENAQVLAKYVHNRMKELTKAKKEQLLKSMFKTTPKTEGKSALKSIEELSNLGAFKNDNYKNKVIEKLNPKLQKLLKESDIDFGELVKKGTSEVNFSKTKFLKELSEKIKVDDKDARTILQVVEKRFDELADEKRGYLYNQMFKKRTVSTRKSSLDKIIELANMDAFDNNAVRDLIKEKYKLPTLTDDVITDIVKQSKDIQKVSEKGLTNLLDLMEKKANLEFTLNKLNKASTVEKLASFNYIQQLFGTLTQIRNIAGNETMYRSFRLTKYPASLIDWSKSKIFGTERQITFAKKFNPWTKIKEYASDVKTGAKAGWQGYSIIGTNDKFNIAHKSFTGKWNPLNYMESMLGAALNGFDYAAYMRGVKERLYELAVVSVKNSKQSVSKEVIQNYMDNLGKDIFEMAEETGKYLTLRDKNNLSQTLNYVKNAANKIGIGQDIIKGGMTTKPFGFGNIVMNYPQSTGALVKAAFDYSPAGFLNSLVEIMRPLTSKLGLANPVDTTTHYAKIVDSFSKALVGSIGFTGLGYYLYNQGIITANTPKDYEASQLQQEEGYQKYSININGLVRWIKSGFNKDEAQPKEGDTFVSYNWLQPVGLSVSLGATYAQNLQDKSNEGKNLAAAIGNAVEGAASTLADQTLLTGASKFIQGYSGKDVLQTTAESLLTGMTGQYTYQIRKWTDNARRNIDSDDPIVRLTNALKNKIPGLSKTLPEIITTTGKTSEIYQGGTNNILNIVFNPAFVSKYTPTAGTKLILDLYKQTGETKQFPRQVDKSITYNGKKVTLTPEEVSQLQKIVGERTIYILDLLSQDKFITADGKEYKLSKSEKFTTKTPEEQVDIIYNVLNNVGSYGRQQLKEMVGQKSLEDRAK